MAKMRISPELKKLIEKYRCVKDTEGMSPAKVYKLVGENENLYLKMTDSRYKGTTYDVEREKDMMLWLEGKLPVPKVLHFERHDGWSNLLMSEADGVLCSEEYEDEQSPEKIIELYAECIRLFHSIDISDCPYTNSLDSRLAELDYLLNNDLADVDCENWEEDTPFKDPRELYDFLKTEKPEEELVFSHGDLGDSKLLFKHKKYLPLYHLDLIPYNQTTVTETMVPSSHTRIKAFCRIIHNAGISINIRTQFGSDINAACGQLAGAYRDDQKQGERTMSARDVKSFGEEVEASC